MKSIVIKQAYTTPEINFDPAGTLLIKGKSIHENTFGFYNPLMDWIREYIKQPAEFTVVDLYIDYLNSASTKALMETIKLFKHLQENGHSLLLNWNYEVDDDDMESTGQFMEAATGVKFNFKTFVPEEDDENWLPE